MGQRGQRSYAYVQHKDTALQEVLGNMKKRVQPSTNSQFNPITHQGDTFGVMKDNSRKQLTKKIVENYELSKGILPYEDKQNRRVSSIKIVRREPSTGLTGASLLNNKSVVLGSGHPQRKHVHEYHYLQKSAYGRKHFPGLSEISRTQMVQHHRNDYSTKMKVMNDLMSSIPDSQFHRGQKFSGVNRRSIQKLNRMLKTSYEAGLQPDKHPTISAQKQAEINGNGLNSEPVSIRNRRDDYRKSSIVFG